LIKSFHLRYKEGTNTWRARKERSVIPNKLEPVAPEKEAAMEKAWYKSYAKGVPFHIQYEPTPMPQALARTVKNFPEKSALIFIDSKISYRQLNEMANRFANFLLDMGVKPGDKIAMLMPNMPQLVAATYGAWKAGAVVVMNNPLYTDT
jgi:long-chain acyl-CoA synthetase